MLYLAPAGLGKLPTPIQPYEQKEYRVKRTRCRHKLLVSCTYHGRQNQPSSPQPANQVCNEQTRSSSPMLLFAKAASIASSKVRPSSSALSMLNASGSSRL